MKSLLFPLLFLSISTLGQISPYAKLNICSGKLEGEPFGIISTIGGGITINKYISIGVTGGYFRLSDYKNCFFPVGIDINVSNFKSKKIKPVFTAQLMYPFHKDETWQTNGNGDYYVPDGYDGKLMLQGSVGVLFPFWKIKVIPAIGYGALIMQQQAITQHTKRGMFIGSIAIFLQ